MTTGQNRADSSGLRMLAIGVISFSLFASLFLRAFYLQVMDSSTFRTEAAANQVRIIDIAAPRGRILDRNGRMLVDNLIIQAVTVERRSTKEDPGVIDRLAALLGVSRDEMKKRVDNPLYSDYRPVPVAEGVSQELVVYLREHRDDFPGVEATQVTRRSYPNGTLAAHVLGYVGEINDAELKVQKKNGYRLGDDIGKNGAEQAFERYLRGTPGVRKLEVNSGGRVLRVLGETQPVPGNDLRLTVDLDVQRIAEDSLAQALGVLQRSYDEDNGKRFTAPAGSTVVLNPTDGSVLAMASFPTYDPSQFVNGISSETFAQLQDPANHFPLNNRAIQGQYAPGSTFKLVTATAALRKGLVTPSTTLIDTGSFQVGNREFFNAGKKALGPVDMVRATAYSSDVYFYKIGAEIWFSRDKYGHAIQDEASAFGFGKKSGIELSSELSGRVPTPESRKRDHDKNPKAFPESRWFAGDNVNLAIGQGETLATPLQLANAYATFANGGTIFQPRVGDRIVDDLGKTVHQFETKQTGRVEMDSANRESILAGLRGATSFFGGTATQAFAGFSQSKFPIAGKTGTAQVFGKQDSALFVGFGPATSPQYVVAVVLEEAGFGGVAAAPVARRVFDQLAGDEVKSITLGGSSD